MRGGWLLPVQELSQQRNHRSRSHHGEPESGYAHDETDDEDAYQEEDEGANAELFHGGPAFR